MENRKLKNYAVYVIDKNGKLLNLVASYYNKEDFKQDLRSDGYKIIEKVRTVNIHKYNDLSQKGKDQRADFEEDGMTEIAKWYVKSY